VQRRMSAFGARGRRRVTTPTRSPIEAADVLGAPLRFSSAILPPYARRSASSAASRLQDDQEPKQVPARR
jgi:hypothetical protein